METNNMNISWGIVNKSEDFPNDRTILDNENYKRFCTPDNLNVISNEKLGVANGVATLAEDGKVPASQLPSYVDDVLEYDEKSMFPLKGENGKIYVDTSTDKTYRWSGSTYVEISASIVIGSIEGTAFDGKLGTDHINNTENPHEVTKDQVGLGNVENKSSATIRSEITKEDISATLGYLPVDSSLATETLSGLMSNVDKKKLNGIAEGATDNIGTITEIIMNGTSKGTSGVVDLGDVPVVYVGADEPSSSLGKIGDIYIKKV